MLLPFASCLYLLTLLLSIVTLSGSEHFEGFLIQARDAMNPDGSAVGSFALVDPKISQRLTCNSIEVLYSGGHGFFIVEHKCFPH